MAYGAFTPTFFVTPKELAMYIKKGVVLAAALSCTVPAFAEVPTQDAQGTTKPEIKAVDLFMRDQAVVLKPKQVVLELSMQRAISYTEAGSSTAARSERSTLVVTGGAQVGIVVGLSGFVSMPVQHVAETSTVGSDVSRTKKSGAGELTLGLQKTLLTETADFPHVSLGLNAQLPTAGERRRALGTSLNFSRSVDPAILFATVSYGHIFSRRNAATIPPTSSSSNIWNIAAGTAVAINDKLSLNGALSATLLKDSSILGRERYRAQAGVTYVLSRSTWVHGSASWGLSGGPTSDSTVGLTVGTQF